MWNVSSSVELICFRECLICSEIFFFLWNVFFCWNVWFMCLEKCIVLLYSYLFKKVLSIMYLLQTWSFRDTFKCFGIIVVKRMSHFLYHHLLLCPAWPCRPAPNVISGRSKRRDATELWRNQSESVTQIPNQSQDASFRVPPSWSILSIHIYIYKKVLAFSIQSKCSASAVALCSVKLTNQREMFLIRWQNTDQSDRAR